MLIIFDCDGVLVDSELLGAQVFSKELEPLDIPMSTEQCHRQFLGRSLAYCFAWLEREYGRALPDDFPSRLEQSTIAAFSRQLRPVPGIKTVLELLDREHVPYCVASNGSHAKIRNSLEVTGLLPHFSNRRFSVEDVAQGKPAPDLYLYAAESMGVPASFTTVVEDSPAGLEAALAAGMRALMYIPDQHSLGTGISATVFKKMEELPDLLGVT